MSHRDPNANRPGYKETKVGWIPEEWEVRPINEIAEVRFSGVDKLKNPGESIVKLCNYTNVFYSDSIRDGKGFMEASATDKEIERFQIKQGDVLATKDSETADDIAKPCYIESDLPGTLCGYHLALIRPFNGSLSGRYLNYSLRRDHTRNEFARFANGVTRFGLTLETFSKVEIPFPVFSEQLEIAEILSTSDELIGSTSALIAAKNRQKKALMQKLLTGQVRVRV